MKKIIVSLLMVSLIGLMQISMATGVDSTEMKLTSAQEIAITKQVKNSICDSYSEYYKIPEISVEIEDTEIDGENVIVNVKASFTKILKAKTPMDLPYVQGMIEQQKEITSKKERKKVRKYVKSLVQNLKDNYIGVEQGENAHFELKIPMNQRTLKMHLDNYEMDFVGENGYRASMKEYTPQNASTLKSNGIKKIKSLAANDFKVTSVVRTTDAKDYDRVDARDYIRKWTDACGSCHCSNCSSSDIYNPKYDNYHNNDCANYVSQAIYAGGISTDGTWAPGKLAWVNTGSSSSYYGLTDYMVDEGYFFNTSDKMKAFAGSIISWENFSHVGMVDQNDTVTMTFCAHTNDRYQSSFKNYSAVEFYVPVWDSYANEWTTQ